MLVVESSGELTRACADLGQSNVVYLDTEFDSGRDGVRLSLVQISRGEQVYLVDALRLSELRPLGAVLSRPGVTWVLHAGQQDVALLANRLSVDRPERVFDTQVAWALVTIEHSTSLAYLKYRLLGIRGEKAHQADDWTRRPLPETQLAYAAEDVEHLPALYRALIARTEALGRTAAVLEASAEILHGVSEPPAPLAVDDFRNAWQLEREGQAVLQFLVRWFNGLPPGERSAAPDIKGLFSIASRRPRNLEQLGGLKAVPRRTVNHHGRALIVGIQQAVADAQTLAFTPIEPPPYLTPAELLAHGWLEAIRAEICATLEIAPEIALPARLTRKLRQAAVDSGRLGAAAECLSGWRAALLGRAFTERAERYGPLPGALGRPAPGP